ncbi:segment polarity protein dishevelled-like protein DVL-2-like [Platysternon megacephalum]|uniref:Segment polarity protein dishevelled-like protein DVL-2-like n=1 Tax=Platysternon megacephalum TaxID=55544 RepID=A0A4D9DQ06_9SAUR|nr:segment polarity protein dishevelled-like protein DVL-2-like [Platysternon megacephalum]
MLHQAPSWAPGLSVLQARQWGHLLLQTSFPSTWPIFSKATRDWEPQARLEGHFPPGTCVTPSRKPHLLLKLESTCHRGRPRGMVGKCSGSFPCCAEGSRPSPLPQGPHTRHQSLKATMLSTAVPGGSREWPRSRRAQEQSYPRSCLACASLEQ